MREKELRLALICYGGVSLAVYMHGVTKEIWRLARASRAFHDGTERATSSQRIYRDLLEWVAANRDIRLRVLPDIISGASAGGINGIFLGEAIAAGKSLEPLTRLWLDCADIDMLLAPDARPLSRFTKFWAQPLVWMALKRPGNQISMTVARPARAEVRAKVSRLIRGRWFAPPFSGIGFSRLLADALDAMDTEPAGPPLLPAGQPLDVFVTATDFHGRLEPLTINSPPQVVETEHRVTIGFRWREASASPLAPLMELVFAARATASFPGAFPPLAVNEIDRLAKERHQGWPGRDRFLAKTLMGQNPDDVTLIDGAVLSNAPFEQAIDALRDRPAHREVDRRFVYIDPTPDLQPVIGAASALPPRGERPGWFSTIFAAMSGIPRAQPIRDNLQKIEGRSRRIARMRRIVEGLREEVEASVEALFGRTWFLDHPTPARIAAWRQRAQSAAATQAGYAYAGYAQIKYAGIIDEIAGTIGRSLTKSATLPPAVIRHIIERTVLESGMERLCDPKGGATDATIRFFRAHDLGFRIRRMRFMARRLAELIEAQRGLQTGDMQAAAIDVMHDTIYACLSRYLDREQAELLGDDFPAMAARVAEDCPSALHAIETRRDLKGVDALVDEQLAIALAQMPADLRRTLLLAYLGYAFYDVATLPLLQGEGLNEFDPVKVDRICPDDACSIREGGAAAMLKGIEFNNFGAFFSRSYRENDYLWGRLHGAERLMDITASTLEGEEAIPADTLRDFKRRMFLAILEEEEGLDADPGLVPGIRAEIEARMG